MSQRLPLVVVLGATACGKSKLAIELAQRFKGEIISADSMQVYKGLDIVTNKVSSEEQEQAKHHMIDYLDPLNRCSVIDFRNKSLDIITNLQAQNKLPIIVGGTNYYIESLLWKGFLLGPALDPSKQLSDTTIIDSEKELLKSLSQDYLHTDEDLQDVDKFFSKPIYNEAFAHIDCEKLWSILEQVDPTAAHLYHPHDKRRVIRSLQVFQAKKRTYTEILDNVNKSCEEGKQSLGGPLRFIPTCVIWLSCDSKTLDKILDERVDQMLKRGLLAELVEFHDLYNKQRPLDTGTNKPEYDKGVFQTIGFKEFHSYLALNAVERGTEKGERLLKKSIVEMKLSTRRYARRQLKWIRRRFLQSGTRDLPLLFELKTVFDEKDWPLQVQQPAFEIVERLINQQEFDEKLLAYKREPEKQEAVNNPGKFVCEVCDKILIGSHFIDAHLKSRMHNKRLQGKRQKTMAEEEESAQNLLLSEATESSSR